jgi:hypothetical protein
MELYVLAGLAQLTLVALLIATHRRVLAGYTVPMTLLAGGMLAGWSWAIVAAAVLAAVFVLNHVLEWWVPYLTGWSPEGVAPPPRSGPAIVPPRPGRPRPDLGHVSLGATALVLLALAWVAVGALPTPA